MSFNPQFYSQLKSKAIGAAKEAKEAKKEAKDHVCVSENIDLAEYKQVLG